MKSIGRFGPLKIRPQLAKKKGRIVFELSIFQGRTIAASCMSVRVFRGELAISFPGSAKSYHVEFLVQQKLNMVLDLFIFGEIY